ncbi:hypothetical protein [Sulfitobacter sp.]
MTHLMHVCPRFVGVADAAKRPTGIAYGADGTMQRPDLTPP